MARCGKGGRFEGLWGGDVGVARFRGSCHFTKKHDIAGVLWGLWDILIGPLPTGNHWEMDTVQSHWERSSGSRCSRTLTESELILIAAG